jgi:hypothetical protein
MAPTLASSNASQFLVPQYLAASRQELERLHRELERKDAILLTMAQRIPELEVAREQRESPQTPSEQQGGVQPILKTEARRRRPGGAASSGSNSDRKPIE